MALKDLIATSGARNFETMRKGWLPTPEEQSSRRLKDLQIQGAEQTLAYAPTKRKLAKQKAESDINYQQSLMDKHDRDAARLKTEDEKKQAEEKAADDIKATEKTTAKKEAAEKLADEKKAAEASKSQINPECIRCLEDRGYELE